jgi:CRISPR/Cas system-associated exonuclease Cas4 (RecB family)
MSLPERFVFSQSSLQDYVDCQRRFQLRYLLHQQWPAVEAEPYLENERRIDLGSTFHKVVHQYLVGVPESDITRSVASDEILFSWWNNYQHSIKAGVIHSLQIDSSQHVEELTLYTEVGKFHLIAKFDLLIHQPEGKWTILDWKTSENRPKRKWLADRWQTHVYPYVLTKAGASLANNHSIDPNEVEMIYWFTNYPEQPERFSYSLASFTEDERMLSSLIATIHEKGEGIYPLTPDTRRCLFCTYRSLCNRGVEAGDIQHLEEWLESEPPDEVKIDLDQIEEIEF